MEANHLIFKRLWRNRVYGTNFRPYPVADMQREVCRWRRIWPVEQARSILAFRALQMSNRILEWSGLLEKTTPEAKQTP